MTDRNTDTTLRQGALVAGIAIIIMTVAAVVAMDVTIGSLIVEGDAASTINNIKTSEMLFRIGVFSWLVILICDVLAAWGLYIFLKPVNKSLSLIMAWFRLIYAAILGAALLNFVYVLLLIKDDGPAADQLQANVLLFLNGFYNLWGVGLIIFGLHILFLGYLAFRSGYIPKILGILLIIAFFGYLITNLLDLLLPDYEDLKTIIEWIFIIPMLSEVALGIWLLAKGGKAHSA